MTRFREGDLVMVRPDLKVNVPYASDGEEHPCCCFVSQMAPYMGGFYEINHVRADPVRYNLKGCGSWMFTDSMLIATDDGEVYHIDLGGFLVTND